ncbi:hypothetical protein GCM10010515_75790 [Streptomyces fructofermentans]|uniref:Uncharacterized protein n=1 Tax=Streptomyces fructofermentans TaxID=152141 RepID=A0A918NUW7_9ACTN|nr:hypothetical protein GCM10010515_75790 [Streptomyces fructofermentans]
MRVPSGDPRTEVTRVRAGGPAPADGEAAARFELRAVGEFYTAPDPRPPAVSGDHRPTRGDRRPPGGPVARWPVDGGRSHGAPGVRPRLPPDPTRLATTVRPNPNPTQTTVCPTPTPTPTPTPSTVRPTPTPVRLDHVRPSRRPLGTRRHPRHPAYATTPEQPAPGATEHPHA